VSALDGIEQGIGVAAHEIAGGVWDLLSKPIEGAVKDGIKGAAVGVGSGVVNLIARPLVGGKVLVERIFTGATQSTRAIVSKSEAIDSDLVKTHEILGNDTSASDLDDLTEEEFSSERAYKRAVEFIDLWGKIDSSGNRVIDETEMKTYLKDSGDQKTGEI
jgi:hypothetical protein